MGVAVPLCRRRPHEDTPRLRALLDRSLGGTDSEPAGRLLSPDREKVGIPVRPTSVYRRDVSNRMPSVE